MASTTPWTVPLDHPALAGHFPGTPILPGVALLDWALHQIAAANGIALDTCTISAVKFLSPVRAGDTLEIQHRQLAGAALAFDIVAGARRIASGSIVPGTREHAQ